MLNRYRKFALTAFFLVALSIIVAACQTDEPIGDCLVPEDGRLVAGPCDVEDGVTPIPTDTPSNGNGNGNGDNGFATFRAAGCAACHAIDGTTAQGVVGPNLTNIAAEGEAYIRESIVDPNAVIADGCPGGPCQPNIMPLDYEERLTQEQIDAIVDYLANL